MCVSVCVCGSSFYLEVLVEPAVEAVLDLEGGAVGEHRLAAGVQPAAHHVRALEDRHLCAGAC